MCLIDVDWVFRTMVRLDDSRFSKKRLKVKAKTKTEEGMKMKMEMRCAGIQPVLVSFWMVS